MTSASTLQNQKRDKRNPPKAQDKIIIKIRMEIHEIDKETTEKKINQMKPKSGSLKISIKLINFEPDCGRLNNGPSKDIYPLIPRAC